MKLKKLIFLILPLILFAHSAFAGDGEQSEKSWHIQPWSIALIIVFIVAFFLISFYSSESSHYSSYNDTSSYRKKKKENDSSSGCSTPIGGCFTPKTDDGDHSDGDGGGGGCD